MELGRTPHRLLRRVWVPLSLAIVALGVLACIGVSVYVGWQLTHKERQPITETPHDYGMTYENATFISKDGKTRLKGWIISPQKPARMTVVFAHGYGNNRVQENVPFLPLAKRLAAEGYRVVLFDFRASGESGGDMITIGVKEKDDLLGVIDYAKKHFHEPIALYGVSMGAATSILAAAEDGDVRGVIADSPFSDLESYLRANMPVWTHLPDVPFTYLILAIVPALADLDLDLSSPIRAVDRIAPRPILFIHSKDDRSIPYEESVKLYRTHSDVFQLWLTEKADHVKSFSLYGDEYVERVLTFLRSLENTSS
ncbi:alpha/beta hydrolase [Geobacillus subterraneus]|uniref:Alpha/beta hydrolase n=2 Tax=Geobacillus TaxID=129337 RepID=A0ABN4NHH4_9BACL|nr:MULTISPECIES: alpha/beta fold hydrolase [Geobacillus]AMX83806.1 alpha/beta hydrolase [Geobacillus subterraneus]KZS26900.1 alpha/beta hydrolase [Geobacillus subterraneus]OXB88017.1 alpha/beta hydrolase [Geobacillus uzenensis]QIZ67573.1 alpha/beta fold hydrolase [Geobacillus subterraneus]WPZ19763.1 alpha/beta fold hydrolase [Geobacillus subterraneus]